MNAELKWDLLSAKVWIKFIKKIADPKNNKQVKSIKNYKIFINQTQI